MKEATAFSPCHITGLFQIFDQSTDPLYIGSRGAGVSLDRGIKTHVKISESPKNSVEIKINGTLSTSAEVSNQVTKSFLSKLTKSQNLKITIEHYVDVPVGAGFGTSGAAALSMALALNEAFELGLSKIEAAQIAHIVEVECKTGLGTVIAETFGGLEIRIKPGAPGIGEVRQIPVPKDTTVACLTFGSLSTKKLLTDRKTRERINELGGKLVDKLTEEPELSSFMKLSRQFAEHVGLLSKKTKKVLKATDSARFACSMPMFGESVFTLVEHESLEKLVKIYRKYDPDGRIITSKIDFQGARVLK